MPVFRCTYTLNNPQRNSYELCLAKRISHNMCRTYEDDAWRHISSLVEQLPDFGLRFSCSSNMCLSTLMC